MSKTEVKELKLYLWDKEMTLSDALSELDNCQAAQKLVIREIAKRMLLNNKIQELDIAVSEDEEGMLLEKVKQKFNLQDEASYQEFLDSQGVTAEELNNSVVYEEQLARLRDQLVSKEEVLEAFAKSRLMREQVAFSIIRVQSKELADQICNELQNDFKDFSELARAHSMGENAEQGGLIGPLPLSAVNPTLVQVLTNMRPGQMTQPIPSDNDTFIIIQLNSLQRMSMNSQIAESLKNQLFNKWINDQLAEAEMKLDY